MNRSPLLKKYVTLSGYITLFLIAGLLLSGCRTFTIVKTDQVHIPGAATPFDMTGNDYRMIYAVSKDIRSNYLTVSQFGIFAENVTQVGIRHGLSASMNLSEMNHPYHAELRHFLKTYDYRSLEDLAREYQTAAPLIPDSSFVALPDRMGRQLFALVKKIDDWKDWISRWQTGI